MKNIFNIYPALSEKKRFDLMEDELAGVVANGENGGMDWPLGAQHAHLIKHEGQVLHSAGSDWRRLCSHQLG
jgi:hypothetical protein